MTYREISFVYPLLNTISVSKGISVSRKGMADRIIAKLKPFVDQISTTTEDAIIAHGERDTSINGLGKFKLKTKEQHDAAKRDISAFKDTDVKVTLNAAESQLVEILLNIAILNGAEDFPEI